jgi:hypothetical protein
MHFDGFAHCRLGADKKEKAGVADTDKMNQFTMAGDINKTLVSLTTAVLTVTITFSHDLFNGKVNDLLIAAWVLLFLSIICSVWSYFATLGSVSNLAKGGDVNIYDANTGIPMGAQQVTFAGGLVLLAIFAINIS